MTQQNSNARLTPSYNLLFQPVNQPSTLSVSSSNYSRQQQQQQQQQLNQSFQHQLPQSHQIMQQQQQQEPVNTNYLNTQSIQSHTTGGSLPDLTSFQFQANQQQQPGAHHQNINKNNNSAKMEQQLVQNANAYDFSAQLLQVI